MNTYTALIAANIYRDGGSLEVIFQVSDGTRESLWLSVLPWDRPTEKAYGALRVSADDGGAGKGRAIPIGSAEEQEIVARLRDFLRAPKVDVALAQRTDSASRFEKGDLAFGGNSPPQGVKDRRRVNPLDRVRR